MPLNAHLVKRFPHFTIDIGFTCEPGQLLAFVGPSGAGKTSIIRMLAGLETPDTGLISHGHHDWFDSETDINLPPQQRQLGYVFQEHTLFPHLNVEKNIAFAAKEHWRVEELLNLFKISDLRNRKPGRISGGERQRVALAQALASDPKVLLLDEPFSALDILTRKQLRKELKELKKPSTSPSSWSPTISTRQCISPITSCPSTGGNHPRLAKQNDAGSQSQRQQPAVGGFIAGPASKKAQRELHKKRQGKAHRQGQPTRSGFAGKPRAAEPSTLSGDNTPSYRRNEVSSTARPADPVLFPEKSGAQTAGDTGLEAWFKFFFLSTLIPVTPRDHPPKPLPAKEAVSLSALVAPKLQTYPSLPPASQPLYTPRQPERERKPPAASAQQPTKNQKNHSH